MFILNWKWINLHSFNTAIVPWSILVIAQWPNTFLSALSSCSSQESIRNIFASDHVLRNDMCVWRQSWFLLWVLFDIFSKVNIIVLIAIFSFDSMSSILNTEHRSLRLVSTVHVSTALICNIWVAILLCSNIRLSFSTNVTFGPGNRHFLVLRSTRNISNITFWFEQWSLSLFPLFSKTILIVMI